MGWTATFQALGLELVGRLVGLEVQGAAPDLEAGPHVIAANHRCHLDALVVLAALLPRQRARVAVAAAEDYFFSRPLLGWLARNLANAMPMRRHGPALGSLRRALAHLASGGSVLVFPEGSRDAAATAFRPGVGLLAARGGAPVVPVAILGTERVLPRGARLPRPGRVRVVFGQPIAAPRQRPPAETAAEVQHAVERLARLGARGSARLPSAATA